MPADFEACVKKGGRMVTKTLPDNKYVHGCRDKKGWHWGEVKEKKNTSFIKK